MTSAFTAPNKHLEEVKRASDDSSRSSSVGWVVGLMSCIGHEGLMSKYRTLLYRARQGCTVRSRFGRRIRACTVLRRKEAEKSKFVDSKTHGGVEELRQRLSQRSATHFLARPIYNTPAAYYQIGMRPRTKADYRHCENCFSRLRRLKQQFIDQNLHFSCCTVALFLLHCCTVPVAGGLSHFFYGPDCAPYDTQTPVICFLVHFTSQPTSPYWVLFSSSFSWDCERRSSASLHLCHLLSVRCGTLLSPRQGVSVAFVSSWARKDAVHYTG
jgi:hypothetical protein